MWLNDRDLDIRCVRLSAYKHDDDVFLDVQQVIPLRETADYQIQIREKRRQSQSASGRPLWRDIKGKRLSPMVDANPYQSDSHRFTAFEIILQNPGISYEDWVERVKLKRPQDGRHPYRHLKRDFDRGRVRIDG